MIDKIKEIEAKKPNFVILVVSSAKNYRKATNDLLRYLINEKNSQCIYVTANEPYGVLLKSLQAEDIKTENIFFIDMITKSVGQSEEETSNCVFLDTPQNLTDMTIAMHQAAELFEGRNPLIVLDSISTLLVYNNLKVISKFSHFFAEKVRLWKARGVIFSVEKETDEKLLELLTHFCDERIDIT